MNLISNCCLSNFLLRLYGLGNENPFAWIDMDFKSFHYLLTNWDKMNFDNIMINKDKHPYFKGKDIYEIIIENNVHLRFVHSLFDASAKTPIVHGENVRYCKIWEYIVEKYNERKERMIKNNLPPMFVLEWEHLDYDESAFETLLNTDLKYKVVVITYNKKFANVKKDNLMVIYDEHRRGGQPNGCFPIYFARVHKDKILKFLNK